MPTFENISCPNSYRHEALILAKCWFPRERNTCYFANILVDLCQFIGKHWFTIGGVKEIHYPNSNGYDPRFWRNCDHHKAILTITKKMIDMFKFIGKHWFRIGGVKEINYPNSNGYHPRFLRNWDHHKAILTITNHDVIIAIAALPTMHACHPSMIAIHAREGGVCLDQRIIF